MLLLAYLYIGLVAGASISSSFAISTAAMFPTMYAAVASSSCCETNGYYVGDAYYSCHTGRGGNVLVKYIYLKMPTGNETMQDTTISVLTPWYVSYHKRLRTRLEKELGLQIITSDKQCGWSALASVKAASVWRGGIEFHNKEYIGDGHERNAGKPDPALVKAISDVMLTTYPAVEIFLIVFFTVGFILIPLLACCCATCCRGAKREARYGHA